MSIKLTHQRIKIKGDGGFRAMDLDELDGLVLALDWVVDEVHHVWGSAVMVAPGVAVTARHVVEEMRDRGFLEDDGGYLLALGVHKHGMMVWNADSFSPIGGGDLSVLTLARATYGHPVPADGYIPVNAAVMAARMPDLGETLYLIGFSAAQEAFDPGHDLALTLLGGVGPVLDNYPDRRDRRLDGPSAAVAATTVGGMSGGGAFDADGNLIGIVSSGIGEDPSFISFLWPCIFTPLEIAWPPAFTQEPTSLHDLSARGLCDIVGVENVQSHQGPDGTPLVSLIVKRG